MNSEIARITKEETDPKYYKRFTPITRGPVFALVGIALLGIIALPILLFRILLSRNK